MKLPDTSQLHVLYECVPVHFFFRCRSFSPLWQLAFLTAAIKFSSFSSTEIGLRCCFLKSRSCSFSVIHVNVDIKIQSKERLAFVIVFSFFFFFCLLDGRAIYRRNARGAWNGGRTYVWTYVRFCRNQNLLYRYPDFINYGALLSARTRAPLLRWIGYRKWFRSGDSKGLPFVIVNLTYSEDEAAWKSAKKAELNDSEVSLVYLELIIQPRRIEEPRASPVFKLSYNHRIMSEEGNKKMLSFGATFKKIAQNVALVL